MALIERNGIYHAVIYKGIVNGKRKYKWASLGTDNRKLAKKKARALENRQDSPDSWPNFCATYKAYSKTNKEPATYKADVGILTKFNSVIPYIKTTADFTPKILEDYKIALAEKGTDKATINRHIGMLRSMGRTAWEWKLVEENRYLTVKKIRIGERKPYSFTMDQIKKILEATTTIYQRVFICLLYGTGMRLGEALQLKWVDVNLSEALVWVRVSESWHPKDKEGRTIPISPWLVKLLAEWQKMSKSDYVLSDRDRLKNYAPGKVTTRVWSRRFRHIARGQHRANLEKGSVHTLRHTYAQRMADSGVPIDVLAELLGHSNLGTTRIYYEVGMDKKRSAALGFPNPLK